MIMYIPVTKGGTVDSTRKLLSEQAYVEMIDIAKAKYQSRIQAITDDLTDTYAYISNMGVKSITHTFDKKKAQALYEITFPYSVVLNTCWVRVNAQDPTDAIAIFLKTLRDKIDAEEHHIEHILDTITRTYTRMDADIPAEVEDAADEVPSYTKEELDTKFQSYKVVSSPTVSDVPVESDTKFSLVNSDVSAIEND